MNAKGVDPETFRRVMGAIPTTVSVLTIVDEAGMDRGMTVSAFCSLSLKPPLVLACVGDDSSIADAMMSVTHFGISVLAADQVAVSQRFADTVARGFDGVAHQRGAHGMALLDGAVAHLECRITRRHPGGDHAIIVGEVIAAADTGRTPLIHHRGGYNRLAT